MKLIKKLIMVLVMILGQNELSAQTSSANGTADLKLQVGESNTTEQTTVLPSVTPPLTSESVLTPEQQGFTKIMIDEKPVYMKKVDNIIIEYRPN